MKPPTLTMLPAGVGDALWFQWGPAEDRRQLLVDLGVAATGRAFRKQMLDLPEHARRFELLAVTHVDTDHIYGILSGLVADPPVPGLSFADIWFNGWTHLDGQSVPVRPAGNLTADALKHVAGTAGEGYGGKQGELFSVWLREQP